MRGKKMTHTCDINLDFSEEAYSRGTYFLYIPSPKLISQECFAMQKTMSSETGQLICIFSRIGLVIVLISWNFGSWQNAVVRQPFFHSTDKRSVVSQNSFPWVISSENVVKIKIENIIKIIEKLTQFNIMVVRA